MGKRSIREFFSSPTRYLAQAISKESEFEKPYLEEDRGKMHSDPSWPDWPPFPDIPPWPPLPPMEGPVPGLPGCAILCYPPGGGDCDEPIWCHPGIWCGTDIGCTLCTWVVEGATSGYTPHASGVGSWGIDVWLNSDLVEEDGKALVTICMTDPCGNECCSEESVSCRVCPPEISISWDDDLTDDTIGRGTSISIYVKDGLGPYSWSVSGTGFTLGSPQTDGVSNTLISDNTACGTAVITVTDFCEEVTTGEVRCTFGQWIIQDYANANPSNPDPTNCSTGRLDSGCQAGPLETINGKERWVLNNGHCWGDKTGSCPGWGSVVWNPEHAYEDNWKNPPCGLPGQCGIGTCTGTCDTYDCGGCFMAGVAYYYLWGC